MVENEYYETLRRCVTQFPKHSTAIMHDNAWEALDTEEIASLGLPCPHSSYPGRPCRVRTGRRKWTKRRGVNCSGKHCGGCGRRNGYHERESIVKKKYTCHFPNGLLHPARSPGLNPCDFFIFNMIHEILKSMDPCKSLAVLKRRLPRAIRKLNKDFKMSFRKSWDESLPRRWDEVIAAGGDHIPQH